MTDRSQRTTIPRRGGRAVLTLALGRPLFVGLAVNAARSFFRWHPRSDLRFAIVTDRRDLLPEDVTRRAEIVEIRPGEYGEGFSPKLHLDRLTTADRTLFMDADCLCVGPLEPVFDRFAGRAVSVVGTEPSDGEWFGDIGARVRHFGLEALPKFNGGVYYLEAGERCTRVYDTARGLEARYDELGFVRLRGRPNEEPLISVAMALHGEHALPDDGTIHGDMASYPYGLDLDVLGGGATMLNEPGHPRHEPLNPRSSAHPLVVHFCGYHAQRPPYPTQARRLELAVARGWPHWLATAYAGATRTLPASTARIAKELLRPAYRALFGFRPIVDDRM